MHDGSSMGVGGLECDRATSQRQGRGGIENFLRKENLYIFLFLFFLIL
jgi:hypothetical protein